MHYDLDIASRKSHRAAEMARELLTARLSGRELAGVIFTSVVREVLNDPELLASLLVAQTAISATLLDGVEQHLREDGAVLADGEILQRTFLQLVAQDVTL